MKIRYALCCFIVLASLTACASKEEQAEQDSKEEEAKEQKSIEAARAIDTYKPHLICPQVAIVRELGTDDDYGTENADPTQLVAAAHMKNIAGTCSYQDEGIDIAFKLAFTAAKGPRLGGDKAEFPFFIAVVDPDQSILNKNQMSVGFRFKGKEKTAEQEQDLHVFIPLPKDKNTTGPTYRVLAGFQLSKQQLDEVRREENTAVGLPASAAAPVPSSAKN
jgi:hypothetical protein